MNIEVGSYEAKTKLPELLRGVQSGKRYTITLRGEPIAELGPVEPSPQALSAAAVEDMLSFMASRPSIAVVDIRALRDEGRA
ncbi:MAG: type II toxin-antitoxin system prevent-host-death family antitoxin [Acidithiobacillus sp.]|nr:type II toxin-antitoxin system prevent-host-death family antitoxin [Acidithiobacillus sp.]